MRTEIQAGLSKIRKVSIILRVICKGLTAIITLKRQQSPPAGEILRKSFSSNNLTGFFPGLAL